MSEVAKYLQPRVSECMRDQIGIFGVGSGDQCHACQQTCACTVSADCKPAPALCEATSNASEPINYADVVKCKPNLKMGKGGFQGPKPHEPKVPPDVQAAYDWIEQHLPMPELPMPEQPCPAMPVTTEKPTPVTSMPAMPIPAIPMPVMPMQPNPAIPLPVMPMQLNPALPVMPMQLNPALPVMPMPMPAVPFR